MKPKLWERQEKETSRQFAAFCVYRDMGPQRSIEKAYELIKDRNGTKVSLQGMRGWCIQFHWVNRCLAWEDEQDRQARMHFLKEVKNQSAIQARTMVGLFNRGMTAMLKKDLDKEQVIPLLNIIQASLQELRIAWGIQADCLEVIELANDKVVVESQDAIEIEQPTNVLQLKSGS